MIKPYRQLSPLGKFFRKNIFWLAAWGTIVPVAYWGLRRASRLRRKRTRESTSGADA